MAQLIAFYVTNLSVMVSYGLFYRICLKLSCNLSMDLLSLKLLQKKFILVSILKVFLAE